MQNLLEEYSSWPNIYEWCFRPEYSQLGWLHLAGLLKGVVVKNSGNLWLATFLGSIFLLSPGASLQKPLYLHLGLKPFPRSLCWEHPGWRRGEPWRHFLVFWLNTFPFLALPFFYSSSSPLHWSKNWRSLRVCSNSETIPPCMLIHLTLTSCHSV